ncbi:hypothetical protein RCL1_004972 [Eukaryota sp. TZLM3-RCL]
MLKYLLRRIPFLKSTNLDTSKFSFRGDIVLSNASLDCSWLNDHLATTPLRFTSFDIKFLSLSLLKTSLTLSDAIIHCNYSNNFSSSSGYASESPASSPSLFNTLLSSLIEFLTNKLADLSSLSLTNLTIILSLPSTPLSFSLHISSIALEPLRSVVNHNSAPSVKTLTVKNLSLDLKILDEILINSLLSISNLGINLVLNSNNSSLLNSNEIMIDCNINDFSINFPLNSDLSWVSIISNHSAEIFENDSESVHSFMIAHSISLEDSDDDVDSDLDVVTTLSREIVFSLSVVNFSISFGVENFPLNFELEKLILRGSSRSLNIVIDLEKVSIKSDCSLVSTEGVNIDFSDNHCSIKFDCVVISTYIIDLRLLSVYSQLISTFVNELFPIISRDLPSSTQSTEKQSISFDCLIPSIYFVISSFNSPNNSFFVNISDLNVSFIQNFAINFYTSMGMLTSPFRSNFDCLSFSNENLVHFISPFEVHITVTRSNPLHPPQTPLYPPGSVQVDFDDNQVTVSLESAPIISQIDSVWHSTVNYINHFVNSSSQSIKIVTSTILLSIDNFNRLYFSTFNHLIKCILSIDLIVPLKSIFNNYLDFIQLKSQDITPKISNFYSIISIEIPYFSFKIGNNLKFLRLNISKLNFNVCNFTDSKVFGSLGSLQLSSDSINFDPFFDPITSPPSSFSNQSNLSDLAQFYSPRSSPSFSNPKSIKLPIILIDLTCSDSLFPFLFFSFFPSSPSVLTLNLSHLVLSPPSFSLLSPLLNSLTCSNGLFSVFSPAGPEIIPIPSPPPNITVDLRCSDCILLMPFIEPFECSIAFVLESIKVSLTLAPKFFNFQTFTLLLESIGILFNQNDCFDPNSITNYDDQSNVLSILIDCGFHSLFSLSHFEVLISQCFQSNMIGVKTIGQNCSVFIDLDVSLLCSLFKLISVLKFNSIDKSVTLDINSEVSPSKMAPRSTPSVTNFPNQNFKKIPEKILIESRSLKGQNYCLKISSKYSELKTFFDSMYLLKPSKSQSNENQSFLDCSLDFQTIAITFRCRGFDSTLPKLSTLFSNVPFSGNFVPNNSDSFSVLLNGFNISVKISSQNLNQLALMCSIKNVAMDHKFDNQSFRILTLPLLDYSYDLPCLATSFTLNSTSFALEFIKLELSPLEIILTDDIVENAIALVRNISSKISLPTSSSEHSSSPIPSIELSTVVIKFSWLPNKGVSSSFLSALSMRSFSQLVNSFGIYELLISFKSFNFESGANADLRQALVDHFSPTRSHIVNILKSFSLIGKVRVMVTDIDRTADLISRGKNGADAMVTGTCSVVLSVWKSLLYWLFRR